MSEWPEGWFRGGPEPGESAGSPGAPNGPAAGSARPGASAWPQQPPPSSEAPARDRRAAGRPPARPGAPGSTGGPGGISGPGGIGPHRSRARRVIAIVAIVLALLLIVVIGMYFFFNGKLVRSNVLVDYAGRPAPADGQNWLITGSDSRQGLTGREERVLATGHDISGHRSDTILILHIPSSGKPLLISIPRDSYVPIPRFGSNKINAAFAFGGPKLLAKTVQNATGLYLNHWMGIGFGGLVSVVDSVGGVNMCLPGPMVDPKAGLHLKAGCQTLSGDQALGFVRTRNFAESDLQREQDQRLFIKALLTKITSTGTILNPFSVIPAASGATGSLTVDQGTSLYDLAKVAFALRDAQTTTVPIANANLSTSAGDAVEWDHTEAKVLFGDLNNGTPVPRRLLTGSKVTGTG